MKPTVIPFLVAASIVSATPSKRQGTGVVVTYDGVPGSFTFSFGDCIPFRMDGALANTAEVTNFAKCSGFSDGGCRYQDTPAPVIVPPGVNFVNAGDPAEVVGESAICWELE